MYTLLERVDATELLRKFWELFIRISGDNIVRSDDTTKDKEKDIEKDRNMIEELLLLQDRLDVILKQSFGNVDAYRNTLKNLKYLYIITLNILNSNTCYTNHSTTDL